MNKTPSDGEKRKNVTQQKRKTTDRKNTGTSAEKNAGKSRTQKTPPKGKKPVGRPTPSPDTKERRGQPPKKKTDPQKQQRSPQKRQPPPQNRRRKPVPPEENTSSKLKLKREPKKRTMKQSEADAAAEKILERPHRRDEDIREVRPLAPPKQPASPHMRKIKRILLAVGTIIVLVAVCIVLSMTVFFKIEEITVEGKSRYDKDDIIASSMINIGDNLLLCNTSLGAERIKKDFAYIEEVQIEKKLFNKINITVTEAKPASIVESDGKFIVLSKSGKIIEINDKKKYNVPAVLGAKLQNIKLASTIQYKDSNLKKYLDRILNGLIDLEMDDVITVDISDTSHITLVKENGFKIMIGNFESIEYKLKTAKHILDNNVKNQSDGGMLDVSLASPDGGKSYLKTGTETSEASKEESKKTEESSEKKTEESSKPGEESSEPSSEPETAESAEPEYTDDGGNTDWAEPQDDTYQNDDYEPEYDGGDDYIPEDYGDDTTQGDDYYYEPEDTGGDGYGYEPDYTDTGYEE